MDKMNELMQLAQSVAEMEAGKNREIERLKGLGNELIEKVCELCRIINPQHKDCTYCEEIYSFQQALKG
ncbi:hypothetical protein LCGC14_1508940 [marine sediment metagenome]|uniref:Uncharacterized protein n=1 Tax=marine sediment metagenome TaxID=412755 RepID=A0A0F9J265_9ZZZZ